MNSRLSFGGIRKGTGGNKCLRFTGQVQIAAAVMVLGGSGGSALSFSTGSSCRDARLHLLLIAAGLEQSGEWLLQDGRSVGELERGHQGD